MASSSTVRASADLPGFSRQPQKDGNVSLASHRLEALRGYLGKISQKELASRIGISPRTLSKWENQGKTTVNTYIDALNQLGVT
jgi:DNA-binding transcriptional regulator YiaG